MSIEEEEDASLKDLVTRTLQSNGVIGKIQAQLRASVFLALEEEFREKNQPLVNQATRKLLSTPEGATAAALVHDFLHTLGLDFSLAVFAPESGHPSAWSLPSVDSLSSRLRVKVNKGSGVPLLVELIKARQTPGSEKNETSNSLINNINDEKDHSAGISSSAGGNSNSADINSNSLENSNSHPDASSRTLSQESGKGSHQSHSSQIDVPVSSQQGRKDTNENSEYTNVNGNEKKIHTHTPDSGNGPLSRDLILGDDKQYEDDFSSMSEKDGRDRDEDEDEDEVTEDIEEDFSLDDLLNSSASGVSDQTKDQNLSQASNPPDYQESL